MVLLALLISLCGIAIVASGALFSSSVPKAAAAPQSADISPEAMAQIAALLQEKMNRTQTQQKMDTQLVYELKMDRGQAIADGIRSLETDIPVTDEGKLVVDITAAVSDGLVSQLEGNGAEIISVQEGSVRASVPIDSLESIAALPDVKFVQPKQDSMTSGISRSEGGVSDSGFSGRANRVQTMLRAALQGGETNVLGTTPPTGVGSVTTEGDATHRAFSARGTFHGDGTGIKVGVLSNGVANLAASQALGDLGPVTVLPGQAGTGDEGTAMLEIVHDIAPGAQLFFATANTSITSFAQNIRDLRTAGCDIIIDDVFYFVETPFQDGAPGPTNTNGGAVIQAVNDVTASGAMYFSSAGNSGNLDDNTAGVWEGDFVDGGAVVNPILALEPGRLHSFGGQTFNILTAAGGNVNSLYWSDPLGGATNDYDLFRLNAAGTTVLAASLNVQDGTQDPYEQVSSGAAGNRLVIVKFAGDARFLHLNTNRGRLSIATAGQTHGHSHAANAFSCAATPANLPFGAPPNPVGPFPNPFGGTNATELFSSDGPRRIFFQANGTPYTAGNFSSTGGIVRQKPDITAADGTSVTGVGGFGSPFYGTSAAAPHAGAIAALLKSANPAFTPAQIRAALTSSAIDIEAPG
ncbi:MAG TPA: S8 family serine peptidase, partial [Pyrinomonadaceae bacterium]|nr:S8 family serine peptidase [Pyrinomonadaceae bacterium]